MSEIQPSVTVVEFGVNLGDHGETHRHAVEATRDTTLGELIDRHLLEAWRVNKDYRPADRNKCIELRPICANTKEN